MQFLKARNWSRYSRLYADDKEMLYKYKRIILLSQFTLVCSVVAVVHAIEDLVDGLYFNPIMDSLMGLFIFATYILNERGYHKQARIFLLSFLNIFLFVYSSLANHDLGIYMLYFSCVGMAAVIFEPSENFFRYFFIAMSVTLPIILFLTGFDAFGTVTFEATDVERSFIINFLTSIIILVFFIVFMTNVDEQSQKKLIELAEEVKVKNVNLEKANNELDRFFYSTSHDLKVPLHDMQAILNQSKEEITEASAQAAFGRLQERTTRLDAFLKDILDYTRNRKSQSEHTEVDIYELTEEVLENFRNLPDAGRLTIHKELDKGLVVRTDRLRLLIVFNNLLANAIKYHRLEQLQPWIRIAAHVKNDHLLIEVSDNGSGIEKEVLPKIFNMFYRGTNRSAGSGLGLYIVREAVEKLDGSVVVESDVEVGSTFRISIPIVGDPPDNQPQNLHT